MSDSDTLERPVENFDEEFTTVTPEHLAAIKKSSEESFASALLRAAISSNKKDNDN